MASSRRIQAVALVGVAGAAAAVRAAKRSQATLRDLEIRHEALRSSFQRERRWNRELRDEVHRHAQHHNGLGSADDASDVRTLVLKAAIALVGAEKGLLLSREDADGDGDLDLVVAEGFASDPEGSAVVQHFAREVLGNDEIIRRDHPVVPADAERTPADDEIDSLVATPLYLRDRFSGVVICANRPGGFEQVHDEVLLALGDHAGVALHQAQLRNEVREGHRGVVRVLVEALAARDPERHRESARLAVRAATLANDLEFDDHERDVLVLATLLRGTGELALPDHVLAEQGPLSAEQRDIVELHPRIGFNIVGRLPALRDVARTILYHHERWDGEGYPAGLAGERIPRTARALAVLEAFGAMTHDRPYRAARSVEAACDELVAEAGRQFDPRAAALVADAVSGTPDPPAEHLADAVLEALPLDPSLTPGATGILGPLAAAATDGLTLLGSPRALRHDLEGAVIEARRGRPFGLVVARLEDVPDANERDGLEGGDRLIQLGARGVQRVAARAGGTAYRIGGRRLAILAPLLVDEPPDAIVAELAGEFAGGQDVRLGSTAWRPGDRPEDVLVRAREALEGVRR